MWCGRAKWPSVSHGSLSSLPSVHGLEVVESALWFCFLAHATMGIRLYVHSGLEVKAAQGDNNHPM